MNKPMMRFCIFTQTCIAIAAMTMLIAEILLFVVSPTYARIACQTAKPPGAHDWWSWREIGGQRCWYPGRSGIGKATLYWPPPAESQAAQAMPVPAIPAPAVSLPVRSLPFAERWPR